MNYGPKTITNGLVLYLDAANTKSYPGSGTTWYDLSGNNNTGTLTNGPTFSAGNMGSIVFDGVDDIVTVNNASNLNSTSEMTICCFFNIASFGGNYAPIVFKQNNYTSFYEQYSLYMTNTDVTFAITGADRTTKQAGSVVDYRNLFTYAVGTFNTTTDTIKLYINGLLKTTISTFTSTIDVSTQPLRIGAAVSVYPGFVNGKIYSVTIYSRELSAAEILQNYNANK